MNDALLLCRCADASPCCCGGSPPRREESSTISQRSLRKRSVSRPGFSNSAVRRLQFARTSSLPSTTRNHPPCQRPSIWQAKKLTPERSSADCACSCLITQTAAWPGWGKAATHIPRLGRGRGGNPLSSSHESSDRFSILADHLGGSARDGRCCGRNPVGRAARPAWRNRPRPGPLASRRSGSVPPRVRFLQSLRRILRFHRRCQDDRQDLANLQTPTAARSEASGIPES